MKRILSSLLVLLLCFGLAGCGKTSDVPPRPNDSTLEFWITDNVGQVDFSGYDEGGMFGGHMYLGRGYHTHYAKDGQGPLLPDVYVAYIVTAYPDYSSGGQFVTCIRITDPAVTVYGLTVASPLEEWDAVMREMGYEISWYSSFHRAQKDGFCFSYGGGELCIRAEVTNKQKIVF